MRKMDVQYNVGGIEGLCIVRSELIRKGEDCFSEIYNKNKFLKAGLNMNFVQDNEVHSIKGSLRGMHVNRNHPQGKLINVLSGSIYDVVVDLRCVSVTYKQWFGVELTAENRKQLYIPAGMGHGYLALTEADVLFKVTTHYIPGDETGFAWNSRGLNIRWPDLGVDYVLSKADRENPDIEQLDL